MIVLDENIEEDKRLLLQGRRVRVRHVGYDIGQSGMKDREDVIPLLHSLRQPVLFTRDQGFYDRRLAHRKYGLVYLAVEPDEVAIYVQRLLRHRSFNTKAKRMGKVARANKFGIRFWQLGESKERRVAWK